jgi:hypothetical protein
MNKRTGLVTAGLVAGLVMVGGTAFAVSSSIPDSAGVIHGCYDSGGNMKVIDTSVTASCPKGYSPLDWNQSGPAGTAGSPGLAGPPGQTGPAGPSTAGTAGLDVTIVTVTATTSAFAVCPADHPYLLSGGGYATDGTGNPAGDLESAPNMGGGEGAFLKLGIEPIGWEVAGPTGDNVNAFAICAK